MDNTTRPLDLQTLAVDSFGTYDPAAESTSALNDGIAGPITGCSCH